MAVSPYDHPRYFSGTERRAFVDGSSQKAAPTPFAPAVTMAVESLDRLRSALRRVYVPSLTTGKMYDTVKTLRDLVASPRPSAQSIKQRADDLAVIAETWRESDPDLYDVYSQANESIATMVAAVPDDK